MLLLSHLLLQFNVLPSPTCLSGPLRFHISFLNRSLRFKSFPSVLALVDKSYLLLVEGGRYSVELGKVRESWLAHHSPKKRSFSFIFMALLILFSHCFLQASFCNLSLLLNIILC